MTIQQQNLELICIHREALFICFSRKAALDQNLTGIFPDNLLAIFIYDKHRGIIKGNQYIKIMNVNKV